MRFKNIGLTLLIVASIVSCKQKEKNRALQAVVKNNSFEISWQGKTRLSGGVPAFEGTALPVKEVTTETNQNEQTFRFAGGKSPAEVQVKTYANSNTFAFFVSPKDNHTYKGEDFIGLFFDSIPGYQIGTAFQRYKPVKAWTKPVQIKSLDSLEQDDIQFFLWQYTDSTYAAAIPLGGKGYSATLGSQEHKFGAKSVSLVDGVKGDNIPVMAVAFGNDPYKLIDGLYETGMEIMGKTANLRKNKTYPEALEYIGWCTWNAYGHDVTEEKILSGVSTFTKNNFPLPFMLIDDGWLNITEANGRLETFAPDKTKFPNGLKPVVEKLKNEHGVKNVGVWHTLNAYWAGVDPNSELGKKYKDILVPYQDKVTWTDKPIETFYAPTPKSDAGMKFYDDWYTYLKGEGITAVKVDNQLVIDRIAKGNEPLWEAGAQLEANLQNAIQKHFNGTVLNCMDMTVDAIYHYGSSAVARASEDFFPENNTYHMQHGNAAVHVLSTNYNSLWFSPMVWPDFDMFQSHQPVGAYHAIARAISGGPIYLTDSPGKQNFEILRALVYRDGRIIRADVPARPTKDCLFQVQDAKPFKSFSLSNNAGLLGAWNAADADQVTGTFKPSDVYGLQGEQFAVYDFFDKKVQLASAEQVIPLNLKRLGCKLFVVVPVQNKAAVLGLINKYNAPKTVMAQNITDKEVSATLPEGGIFGAYLAAAPKQVLVDGQVQPATNFTYANGLLQVNIPDKAGAKERALRVVL